MLCPVCLVKLFGAHQSALLYASDVYKLCITRIYCIHKMMTALWRMNRTKIPSQRYHSLNLLKFNSSAKENHYGCSGKKHQGWSRVLLTRYCLFYLF